MSYDGRRLKWVSGLDSLKKIIHESLGLQGKWSSPGGGSKKFTSTNANLSITWYYGKQNTLLLQGKDGNSLRERFVYICQTRGPSSLKPPNSTNQQQTEIVDDLNDSSCVSNYTNVMNVAKNEPAKFTSNSSKPLDKVNTTLDFVEEYPPSLPIVTVNARVVLSP